MKIKQMNAILRDKKSQELNCNFKITGKSGSKLDLILQRLDKIDEFIAEQKQFNQYVVEKFEKQEQFNQYVLDVFKRNQLFQERVEDVFKRNNLK